MADLADLASTHELPRNAHVEVFNRLVEYATVHAPISTAIREAERHPNLPRVQIYRELRIPSSPMSVAVQDLQSEYSPTHWDSHRTAQIRLNGMPYMSATRITGGMDGATPIREGDWEFHLHGGLRHILPEVKKFNEYFR